MRLLRVETLVRDKAADARMETGHRVSVMRRHRMTRARANNADVLFDLQKKKKKKKLVSGTKAALPRLFVKKYRAEHTSQRKQKSTDAQDVEFVV